MKTEEEKIKEEYRKYQLSTQGVDVWEEGAFKAGWLASKNLYNQDAIKLLPQICEGCSNYKQQCQCLENSRNEFVNNLR